MRSYEPAQDQAPRPESPADRLPDRGADAAGAADVGTAVAAPAPRQDVREPAHRRWVSRVALAVVVLLGMGLVALHIDTYRQLSVYDEVQHVDYVYRLLDGELPASGDRWVGSTVDAVACRTIDYPTEYPPCGGPYRLQGLPNSAYTTAFIHTPAYYLGPAAAVWGADLVGLPVDDVTAMRATGAVWLALTLVLLWLVLRDVGVRWQVRAAASLVLVAAPPVLLAHSTVTNDATGLAAGAALTLAALRWDQGRMRLWAVLVIAAAAVLLKTTTLAVLLMICAFVLVRGAQRATAAGRPWWRSLSRPAVAFVGGLAAVAGVIGIGWSVYEKGQATLDERLIPQNALMLKEAFDPAWLTTSLMSMLTPLQPHFLQSVLQGSVGTIAINLANVGLLALAVVGAVRSRPGSAVRALAIATGAAALAFPALLTLINYATINVQFGIPPRYGFTLVPAMVVIAASAVRSRRGGHLFLTVGLVFYAAVAVALLR